MSELQNATSLGRNGAFERMLNVTRLKFPNSFAVVCPSNIQVFAGMRNGKE